MKHASFARATGHVCSSRVFFFFYDLFDILLFWARARFFLLFRRIANDSIWKKMPSVPRATIVKRIILSFKSTGIAGLPGHDFGHDLAFYDAQRRCK